jgi:hypothetical protein
MEAALAVPAPLAAEASSTTASLDFSQSSSPLPSSGLLVLPHLDQQHRQQEQLLKGAHNQQLNQVATPESRALYAACSEGADLAQVKNRKKVDFLFLEMGA